MFFGIPHTHTHTHALYKSHFVGKLELRLGSWLAFVIYQSHIIESCNTRKQHEHKYSKFLYIFKLYSFTYSSYTPLHIQVILLYTFKPLTPCYTLLAFRRLFVGWESAPLPRHGSSPQCFVKLRLFFSFAYFGITFHSHLTHKFNISFQFT